VQTSDRDKRTMREEVLKTLTDDAFLPDPRFPDHCAELAGFHPGSGITLIIQGTPNLSISDP
jgi:hypothetical protein